MRAIEHIRQLITEDIFDYTQLMHALEEYRKPRDVVSVLLQNEQIIRVRKGLYIFGVIWERKPVIPEMLANLVYGPSMISLDYALAWYGLIPERVETITSITTGRSRRFETPLGRYSYKQLSDNRFSYGASIQKADSGNWLITEPLKALADKAWTDKRFQPVSSASYEAYFFEDLRVDEETLAGYCSQDKIIELGKAYSARKISWMADFLQTRFYRSK